jgi:succinate dehydrogenase / fumarate reductase, membrane anchor subunit
MSLRSPLGRVLGLGSARGGSSHWYAQRVTAVALVLLTLWLVVSLASLADASYEQVTGWLRWPLNSALALLLVVVAAWHAVLGLQVVVEDYVADKGTRVLVLIAIKFAFVVAAVVGVLAVLRIAFGVAA